MTLNPLLINLGSKKSGALRWRDDIETIVLGSSHGDFGFNPDLYKSAYNLCYPSQDLYYTRMLYIWSAENLPRLRNIIVFYSAFSAAFDLTLSSEKLFALGFKLVFGIPYCRDIEVLLDAERQYTPTIDLDNQPSDHRGFLHPPSPVFMTMSAEKRAETHARFSAFGYPDCPQHVHLSALIDAAGSNNHNIIIVLPPARSDYIRAMPPSSEIFGPVSKLATQRKVQLVDCYDDSRFRQEHFGDTDHLHPWLDGPRNLSEILQHLKAAQYSRPRSLFHFMRRLKLNSLR